MQSNRVVLVLLKAKPALVGTVFSLAGLGSVSVAGSGMESSVDDWLGSGTGAGLVTTSSAGQMVNRDLQVHQHPLHKLCEILPKTHTGQACFYFHVETGMNEDAQTVVRKVSEAHWCGPQGIAPGREAGRPVSAFLFYWL